MQSHSQLVFLQYLLWSNLLLPMAGMMTSPLAVSMGPRETWCLNYSCSLLDHVQQLSWLCWLAHIGMEPLHRISNWEQEKPLSLQLTCLFLLSTPRVKRAITTHSFSPSWFFLSALPHNPITRTDRWVSIITSTSCALASPPHHPYWGPFFTVTQCSGLKKNLNPLSHH